jgi:hypothetical protein
MYHVVAHRILSQAIISVQGTMYLLEILKEQIVAKNYNGGDNMTVRKMKFRKMGFFEAWSIKKLTFCLLKIAGVIVFFGMLVCWYYNI